MRVRIAAETFRGRGRLNFMRVILSATLGLALLAPAVSYAFDPASDADRERLERAWMEATGLESIDLRSIRPPNPFLEGFYEELLEGAAGILLRSQVRATVSSGGIGADVRCELTQAGGVVRVRYCRDLVGGTGVSVLGSWSKTGTLDFAFPAVSPAVSERARAEGPSRPGSEIVAGASSAAPAI